MSDILLLSVLFAAYALIHSLFSTNRVKGWFRAKWPEYFALYRLVFNICQTLLFLILIVLIPKPPGTVWQITGWPFYLFRIIQIFSVIALAVTFKYFSGSEFLGLASLHRFVKGERHALKDERYHLTTVGPYAVSRHPIYLFSLILVLFEPHMTLFKSIVFSWLLLYFYVGSFFEERRLISEFGEEYLQYRRRVSRIIPVKWLKQKFPR